MMHGVRAAVLAFGLASSVSASAAEPAVPHPAHAMHGSGFHRGHSMRLMLSMSAAVVRPAPTESVPLHGGLGAIDFPITTSNLLAQRYFTQGMAFSYGFNHAAAIARAHQRNRAEFDKELSRLRAVASGDALAPMIEQGVPAADLVKLAEKVALARWSQAHGRFSEAVTSYREAAAIEQEIPYMEPPFWYYPVNQSLGAALYQAGRYQEAQAAFTTALAQSPNNGWVLYGLAASERALGRSAEAQAADAALKRAWSGDRGWLRMDRL